jgi:hypothetical protein
VRSAVYSRLSEQYEHAYQQIALTFGRYRSAGPCDKITSGRYQGTRP